MKKMIKEYGGKEKYASAKAKAMHEKKESKKTEKKEKKMSKKKKYWQIKKLPQKRNRLAIMLK